MTIEMGVKILINKNSKLYKLIREAIYIFFVHPREIFEEKKRKSNSIGKYSSLKQFKGIHCGKRCFIVATGPSLTEKDYNRLSGEYTIGVNGLCLWFNDDIAETDYFVISDDDVYRRVESKLKILKKTQIFISERVKKTTNVDVRFNVFPVNIWNRFIANTFKKKMSNDISVCSYDEETVVFHAIQLALHLGFSEIYLIGTDCNYRQKKKYAADHGKEVDINLGDKMLQSYEVVKLYQERFGFNIYNATRGGMLEIFPRVCLEEILEENKL